MSDSTPNYKIEIKRLKLQISQQVTNIERAELEIIEMEDKVEKSVIAIEAAKSAIEKMKSNLRDLENTHGTVQKEDIDKATKTLRGGKS